MLRKACRRRILLSPQEHGMLRLACLSLLTCFLAVRSAAACIGPGFETTVFFEREDITVASIAD
jgi:hypothetical protein